MVRMVQSLPESVHFGSASKAAFCTATAASAPVSPDAEWSVASVRFCVKKRPAPSDTPTLRYRIELVKPTRPVTFQHFLGE